jgi:hypothetical protein
VPLDELYDEREVIPPERSDEAIQTASEEGFWIASLRSQ